MANTEVPPVLPTMVLPKLSVNGLQFDKINDGWKLIENVTFEGEPKLQLDTCLQKDESYVVGRTMLERAKKMDDRAGQLHAERMLEHQDKIPVEWRNFYLVFTGTIWRVLYVRFCIPYLYWDDGEWQSGWFWSCDSFNNSYRLVRLGK